MALVGAGVNAADKAIKKDATKPGGTNHPLTIVAGKLWEGTEVVALADCTSDPIDVGTTVSLTCLSSDKLPKNYDKATINDTF